MRHKITKGLLRIMKKRLISILLAASLLLMPMTASATFEQLNKGDNKVIVMHDQMAFEDFIQFMRLTSNPKIKHYEIIIHSPGGAAITCIAVMNRIRELQRKGVTFTTKIYGMGMSAGSYVFMLGDERIIYEGGSLMWHTIQAQVPQYQWDALDPQMRALLTSWDDYIRARFQEASGMSKESCDYWLDGGTAQFMGAETAFNTGIATEYIAAN